MRAAPADVDDLLAAAMRQAARRYRMPPLPADAAAARSAGADTALAFALEARRVANVHGTPPDDGLREVFTAALDCLIRRALAPERGDPAFQAVVLRARDAAVDRHVQLQAQAAPDIRSVRGAVDAIAHPGKLRQLPRGPVHERLSRLHALAAVGAWDDLRDAAGQALAGVSFDDPPLREALTRLLAQPALERLVQGMALRQHEGVRRYQALLARHGPPAASAEAAARGRAAAHAGDAAEAATAAAFARIAELLNARMAPRTQWFVARGLRNPHSLPAPAQAKGEWDVALVRRSAGADAVDLLWIAEVKASPAAAAPDLPRLLRGLAVLAAAGSDSEHGFRSPHGELRVRGASLQRLRPAGPAPPPGVFYCCSATEAQAPPLSAAGKAMLLAEQASVAHACRIAEGGSPPSDDLDAVWRALASSPRLRAVLHQYDSARVAREAMLHPGDLLAVVAQALSAGDQASA